MKLIDYVINNDTEIENKRDVAEHYNMTLEEYILDSYCPYYFKLLKYTIYNKPFKPRKEDKTDCKYNNSNYEGTDICNNCWNREISI